MQTANKVNIHAKSGLARLMAIENLSVVHDPGAKTASFDIKNRVLTFPVLKNMNDFIYDAFCAHEIAHALYTPYDETEWKKLLSEIPKEFINITEDARIEKLVQRRYPGTRRDFYELYKYVSDTKEGRDFFGLSGVNVNKLSLIDRINIHFKLGIHLPVKFSKEEQHFVDMVAAEETWEDAVAAAKAIYDYMKQNNQLQEITFQSDMEAGEGSDEQEDDQDSKENVESESSESCEENSGQNGNSKPNSEGKQEDKKNKVFKPGQTQSNYDASVKNLFEEPTADICCGDVSDLSHIYEDWKKNGKMKHVISSLAENTTSTQFFNSITPIVNMMVGQFNMKKSARDFEKTKTSRTGKLDMDKISMYKTTDDIFLTTEYVPEHKNHGIVMFIDFSSSMSRYIGATIKQTFILTEFCRKAQIPFEVYGFTCGGKDAIFATPDGCAGIHGAGATSLFLLLSSTMQHNTYKSMSSKLLRERGNYILMGGTPLFDTAFKSEYILREFKAKHRIQKLTLVVLSDGSPTDGIYKNSKYAAKRIIMRNPLDNKQYSFNYNDTSYHDIFGYINDAVGVDTAVGFYVTNDLKSETIRMIAPGIVPSGQKEEFKTKGYAVFSDGKAFKKYFAVNINNFEIKKDGDKTENLAHNRQSMIFLNTFVDIIS